jgi:hypothetical protein
MVTLATRIARVFDIHHTWLIFCPNDGQILRDLEANQIIRHAVRPRIYQNFVPNLSEHTHPVWTDGDSCTSF